MLLPNGPRGLASARATVCLAAFSCYSSASPSFCSIFKINDIRGRRAAWSSLLLSYESLYLRVWYHGYLPAPVSYRLTSSFVFDVRRLGPCGRATDLLRTVDTARGCPHVIVIRVVLNLSVFGGLYTLNFANKDGVGNEIVGCEHLRSNGSAM